MASYLFGVTLLLMRLPAAEPLQASPPDPVFTDPADLQITQPVLALLTHCSRHFDPLAETQTAVRLSVATMKAAQYPVIYLHDRYNTTNPASKYLYDDWSPTAFIGSDIGNFELNISPVEHVVCLGGFFGQCERSTVSDAIRLWHRDGIHHDLRITQVVDGIFTVGQHIQFEDPYAERIRAYFRDELKSLDPRAVLSVDQITTRIDDANLVTQFLMRQLPGVPEDVNVAMDVFGNLTMLQIVDREAPVLTFAYRRSDRFLKFNKPEIDWDQPAKRWFPRVSNGLSGSSP